MSGNQDPKKTVTEENVIIGVDRSKIEKEQAEELEKRAGKIAVLQKQYEDSVKELQVLKDKNQQDSTRFKEIEDDRDQLKDQLREIALTKFNQDKKVVLEKVSKVLPPEKIKELEEQIKAPADLQSIGYALNILEEMQKSTDERKKEGQTTTDDDKSKAGAAISNITGTNQNDSTQTTQEDGVVDFDSIAGQQQSSSSPQKPPGGSVVKQPSEPDKRTVFKSAKDAIDTLYDRVRKGDKDAEKTLNQLWEKAFQTIKKKYGTLEMAVTECPVCGTGIEANTICPNCGFDPKNYIARGGEFW